MGNPIAWGELIGVVYRTLEHDAAAATDPLVAPRSDDYLVATPKPVAVPHIKDNS